MFVTAVQSKPAEAVETHRASTTNEMEAARRNIASSLEKTDYWAVLFFFWGKERIVVSSSFAGADDASS